MNKAIQSLATLLMPMYLLIVPLKSFSEPVKNKESKRILAVFAHPDDEVGVTTSLAKYAREGSEVYLAFATDGRHGVTEHAKIPAGDKLVQVRNKETQCVTKQLSINPPIMLGIEDGTLANSDHMRVLNKKLKAIIKKVKPDILITWGADGGYGHPDHRTVSNVMTELFQKGGKDWPSQLYYIALPEKSAVTLAAIEKKINTPLGQWFHHNFHLTQQKFITTTVGFTPTDLVKARTAYSCHQSQFTEPMMDDLFLIHQKERGIDYFRRFAHPDKITSGLF